MEDSQVAIVTGGASGIGRALCGQLVARGTRVVIADFNLPGAEQAAQELGPLATAAALDVTDADAFEQVVAGVFERHGRLDMLFNNAGIGGVGMAEDLSAADWKRIVDVNLYGVIHGVAAAYPRMVQQGFGHIVNTASGAGLAPRPGMTPYSTAKFGVVGLTMSLRAEAATHGIHVSVACPGYVATNIMAAGEYKGIDMKKLTDGLPIGPITADAAAAIILRGADRNKLVIIDRFYVWLDWFLTRLAPRVAVWAAGYRTSAFRGAKIDADAPAQAVAKS